jgi:hypothetical protein
MTYSRGSRNDTRNKLRAIEKATKKSVKSNIRLWVVRLAPGRFEILTKGEVKHLMRALNKMADINIYQTGEVIIHITKKFHEI